MKIKSERDFFSGLLFLVLGAAFAWGAMGYTLGSAARMGAGYFPFVVGVLLVALGTVIMFGALVVETEDGEPVGPWAWKPLLAIVGANFAFGALIGGVPAIGLPPMGLVVAVVALTAIASLATGRFAWKESVVLSVVFTAMCWVLFVLILQLKLPLWPALGGA
jgi:hypothetical protein